MDTRLETTKFTETARDTARTRTRSIYPPKSEILNDYRVAVLSRQVSLVGRREVLSGNAKFGIFGDGKELAQIALAKVFRPGDFRSGYYRDQTLMFALGMLSPSEFFAQLFAHADVDAEPSTGGRAMNAHFATRLLDAQLIDEDWLKHSAAQVEQQVQAAIDFANASADPPFAALFDNMYATPVPHVPGPEDAVREVKIVRGEL